MGDGAYSQWDSYFPKSKYFVLGKVPIGHHMELKSLEIGDHSEFP